MSSNKKNTKIKIELEREDYKCLGISRKRGGAGPHGNKATKRRRTRHDDDIAAIEESLEAWEDDANQNTDDL